MAAGGGGRARVREAVSLSLSLRASTGVTKPDRAAPRMRRYGLSMCGNGSAVDTAHSPPSNPRRAPMAIRRDYLADAIQKALP